MAHATIIGVPKEIKTDEHRVAATPGSVKSLVAAGFTVVVEKGAGVGSGHSDEAYAKVRAAAKRVANGDAAAAPAAAARLGTCTVCAQSAADRR